MIPVRRDFFVSRRTAEPIVKGAYVLSSLANQLQASYPSVGIAAIVGGILGYYFIPTNVRRWDINHYKVEVIRERDRLSWVLFDRIEITEQQGNVVSENRVSHPQTEQEEDAFFCQFLPVIQNGEIFFKEPICKYSIDGKQTNIFRLDNKLIYQWYNKNIPRSISQGPIDMEGIPENISLDSKVRYLIQSCLPIISNEGLLSFGLCCPWVCEWIGSHDGNSEVYEWSVLEGRWSSSNMGLKLLQQENRLIWEAFNEATNHISQIPTSQVSHLSIEDRILHFRNFKMGIQRDDQGDLVSVTLLNIKKKSRLDPKVIVDRDKWAVTLIDSGIKRLLSPETWGGHSMIVIEGIRLHDDKKIARYFMEQAHLTGATALHNGVATVKFFKDGDLLPEGLTYTNKSTTFLIDRNLVEKMIERIKMNSEVDYSLFGNNCAAWALEQLRPLGIVISPRMISIPSQVLSDLRFEPPV